MLYDMHPCCLFIFYASSVQLLSHRLQQARPPCPSPAPSVHSNSCPLTWWCHPTISSSLITFSSHLQSLSALGSFPMSQFFTSGSQSIGVSASTSILPMNIQDWFPLRWTGWISLQSKSLSSVQESKITKSPRFFSPKTQFKSSNYSALSFLYSPTLTSIHDFWKNHIFV